MVYQFYLSPTTVALNFQTAGTEMDLNDGLFNQNSSCGYILKPTFLREYENAFDPDRPQDSGNYHPKKLIIKVHSADLKSTEKDVF